MAQIGDKDNLAGDLWMATECVAVGLLCGKLALFGEASNAICVEAKMSKRIRGTFMIMIMGHNQVCFHILAIIARQTQK